MKKMAFSVLVMIALLGLFAAQSASACERCVLYMDIVGDEIWIYEICENHRPNFTECTFSPPLWCWDGGDFCRFA